MRRRTDPFDAWSKRLAFIISLFTAVGVVIKYAVIFPIKMQSQIEEHEKMLKIINSNMAIIAQGQKDMNGKILDIWREQAHRKK